MKAKLCHRALHSLRQLSPRGGPLPPSRLGEPSRNHSERSNKHNPHGPTAVLLINPHCFSPVVGVLNSCFSEPVVETYKPLTLMGGVRQSTQLARPCVSSKSCTVLNIGWKWCLQWKLIFKKMQTILLCIATNRGYSRICFDPSI